MKWGQSVRRSSARESSEQNESPQKARRVYFAVCSIAISLLSPPDPQLERNKTSLLISSPLWCLPLITQASSETCFHSNLYAYLQTLSFITLLLRASGSGGRIGPHFLSPVIIVTLLWSKKPTPIDQQQKHDISTLRTRVLKQKRFTTRWLFAE